MTTGVAVERNVPARMRDGVTLYADVYYPEGDGEAPVLLSRTPYDKALVGSYTYLHPEWYAQRGYIVVQQDVRGRYTSEGDWYPYQHESDDGFDTVEWAAGLPRSNGRVGMYGLSYVGATQMLAAVAAPPHLAAIAPGVTASDYFQAWTYEGGAFSQAFIMSWVSQLAEDTARRMGLDDTLDDLRQLKLAYPRLYAKLPISDWGIPEFPQVAPYYFDWLEHDTWDEYWKAFSIHPRYGQITVPTLQIGGWYDVFLEGNLQNHEGIRDRGGSETARAGQRLLVGPWHHRSTAFPGGVDFGEDGGNVFNQEMFRFYEHHLKGAAGGGVAGGPTRGSDPTTADEGAVAALDDALPVRLFVMGENRWRDYAEWPPANAVDTTFFLRSEGTANSRTGDGRLSFEPPAEGERYDVFLHRQDVPVPSIGGHSCCAEDIAPQGPYDQRKVEDRMDVLVYTTDVLQADLEVTGWVSCVLFAAADGVDADWCAKLVDVFPDGTAINITDGVIRARYRASLEHTSPIEPGEVYEYTINMRATCNVFNAGHRVRLEVASSNFPMFDRNPGTGQKTRDVRLEDFAPRTHRVFHDAGRASRLVLPVVG